MLIFNYQYRIYLSAEQAATLDDWFETSRRVYNYALREIKNWRAASHILLSCFQNAFPSKQKALTQKSKHSRLAFNSSTGFRLPEGAIRSPDVAWVKRSRIEAIASDPDKFLPLCPNFAIELRSANDTLSTLQAKMRSYLDNGLLLGWLIDSQNQTVEIYRLDQPIETVSFSSTLSSESILPDFQLNLSKIF